MKTGSDIFYCRVFSLWRSSS